MGGTDARQRGRGMGLEGGDQVGCGEQEDAGVPQMAPAGQHGRGGGGIGFFDKSGQRLGHGGEIGGRLGHLQPAIAGLSAVGLDAEGHKPARAGGGHGGMDGAAEGGVIGDDVIGRRHQHQGARVFGLKHQGGGQDGGGGVAALGLDQHGGGGDVRLAQLFGDDEAEIAAGHHDRPGKTLHGKAPGRGLKQTLFPRQRRELLGKALARERPKPRAGAAAQKHGMDRVSHTWPLTRTSAGISHPLRAEL